MLAPSWYTEPEMTPEQAIETLVDLMCEYYPDMRAVYTTALIELTRSPQNIPAFCETVQGLLGETLTTALRMADNQAQ